MLWTIVRGRFGDPRRLRRVATAAAIACASLAPATAAAPAASPQAAFKTCRHGYVHAVIGGEQKCLHAGEYCAIRYARQYRRYGFHCLGSPARLH
jgi:hypothetical protein